MNYGLNISASGVVTSMYRQDVMANNLANISTIGYKPDSAFVMQRDAARVEDGLMNLPSNVLLERLGAGTLLGRNRISEAQGELQTTGNALDAAIRGSGFFVMQAEGSGGEQRVRLTRDGRFTLDENGRLVGSATGLAVLDESGRTITVDRAAGGLAINRDGTLSQNGRAIAKIQVSETPDAWSLRKIGNNLFEPTASQANQLSPAANAEVIGGSLEQSGVDPVRAIMGVTSAGSAVSSNARMMQLHDELMGRAINTFGRIS